MIHCKKIILFLLLVLLSAGASHAEEDNAYKKFNPDGLKFEFARSYLASLSYLRGIETRWKKLDEIKKQGDENKLIQWNIERLIMENMDARIAKNYMTKYFGTKNVLMRKVVDSYAYVCDALVKLNREEREAWEEIKKSKESGEFEATQEQEFVKVQEDFAAKRRETMRGIVEVSILMTKVLLSEDTQEKRIKKRLALTSKERDQLVDKLDSYAKDNLDWGVKEGQTFLQAAEASVREVLEDPMYLSADEQ